MGGSPGHVTLGLAVYDWRTANPARTGQLVTRAVLLFGPAIVALNATFLPLGLGEPDASPSAAVLIVVAVPALVMLWYPVLAYGALARPSGRALHDRITGTVVDVANVEDSGGDGPDEPAAGDAAARQRSAPFGTATAPRRGTRPRTPRDRAPSG
jgi:hypothetical protein